MEPDSILAAIDREILKLQQVRALLCGTSATGMPGEAGRGSRDSGTEKVQTFVNKALSRIAKKEASPPSVAVRKKSVASRFKKKS
jgi:hypothetical protein